MFAHKYFHTSQQQNQTPQATNPTPQHQQQNQLGNQAILEQMNGSSETESSSPRTVLRNRSLQTTLIVSTQYANFAAAVEQWLSRHVMSRTNNIHREHELVESSNLQSLHQRLVAMGHESILLQANVEAGENRYESVHFTTPGLIILDELAIEGTASEQPVPESVTLPPAVRELDEQIEELIADRDRMRELGEMAADDTCGAPMQMNENDSFWMRVFKIFANSQAVDPYECAGGDNWRRTMERRANELDERIQQLRRRRTSIVENAS